MIKKRIFILLVRLLLLHLLYEYYIHTYVYILYIINNSQSRWMEIVMIYQITHIETVFFYCNPQNANVQYSDIFVSGFNSYSK